jgi:phosphoribosylamine-glycine ligase
MKALKKELNEDFVGVMYGGFMVTNNGVKLIEYNARFGDPEALNILPILETDFVEVCEQAIAKNLKSLGQLKFSPVATVVKYLCPDGYPDNPLKNEKISWENFTENEYQEVFFASVGKSENEFKMLGSRAVGILGKGSCMSEALENCEKNIKNFHGKFFYREDIGKSE